MNMAGKPVAIVLGGTNPHIELIRQLKERGYYIVLIDYLENPPARDCADIHERESTMNPEGVLSVAQKYDAKLVISACVDQANSVCCYVSEKLGLPHPYSYQTSILVTKKPVMKRLMIENGIPTPEYQVANSQDFIDWESVSFPAVIKPSDCNSSKGVCRVENINEGKRLFSVAIELSRTNQGLVERYIEGTEIQVDCFASDSDVKVILTRQKKHIQTDSMEEMNSSGSIIPAPICEGMEEQLLVIAKKIVNAFGLKNTPFFYQAIVNSENNIYVIEFAPRVGGGLSYILLNKIAGFDAIKAVVNSYLNVKEPITTDYPDSYYSTNLLYMREGVFDHIDGFDIAKKKGLICESYIIKEKGDIIGNQLRSGNRVGAFIVKADSLDELKIKEYEAYKLIDVINDNGESCIRKCR